MRTGLDGTTNGYYLTQRFETWERIRVSNGSDTLVDLSMRVTSYNLQLPQPNLPIGALTVNFARDAIPSLAPFVVGSSLNRLDNGVTYSPLLQIGRTVTMDIAIGQQGAGPAGRPADGSPLWYEVFRGTISKPAWGQFNSHVISITALDLGGVLQKVKSQTAFTYLAGTPIETVAQQILTNNGATWVSFSCPVATGKVLPNDVAPGLQKTVWEQLANLARQSGLVLWWRYLGTGTLQLVMFAPERGKTLVDQTFSIVDDYTELAVDENDIGSTGYIVYFDGNGVQQSIGPMVDSASILKYGGHYQMERPFWIVLTADSPVRDSTSATALLTQALSDVADPDVVATVTMPPLWFGESAVDLYSFPTITNTLFDSPMEAAPFSITIQRNGDQQPYTSVNVRGKPSAGRQAWQRVGGGMIVNSTTYNGASIVLPDVIDSFVLGETVPYVSMGGATDAWPRRPFTVHSTADLTTWSLGGLFLQDIGNVAAFGPQGIENYLRFQNTNTISGPNLGIISNAELAGAGGFITSLALFTGGLVINSNGGGVTGDLAVYYAGGVQRVAGANSVVSGRVAGFMGVVPATHAAVTGESWNLYISGTAQNYLFARTYFGSSTDTTYLERSGAGELNTGARLNAGGGYSVGGSTVITSTQILQNVTFATGLNVALLNASTPFTATQEIQNASASAALRFRVSTDTQYRWLKRTNGSEEWGAGGVTAPDVFVSRSAVGTYQIKAAAGSSVLIEAATNNTVGAGGGGVAAFVLRDQGNQSFLLNGRFSDAAGSREIRFTAGVDRDGLTVPFTFYTQNASAVNTLAMEVQAGANAGRVSIVGAAAAGTEVGALFLDHRVTSATGAGVRMAFRTGAAGATTVAELAAVHTSSTSADLVFRARLSGTVTEGLRLTSAGDLKLAGQLLVGGATTNAVGPAIALLNLTTAPSFGILGAQLWAAGSILKSDVAFDAIGGFRVSGTTVVDASTNVVVNAALQFAATGQQFLPLASYGITLKSGSATAGTIQFTDNASAVKGSVGWDSAGVGLYNSGGTRVFAVSGTGAGNAAAEVFYKLNVPQILMGGATSNAVGPVIAMLNLTTAPSFGILGAQVWAAGSVLKTDVALDALGGFQVNGATVVSSAGKLDPGSFATIGGAAATIGFFGGSGTAKQAVTGAKGGNTALASLISVLAGHGFVTDSTT